MVKLKDIIENELLKEATYEHKYKSITAMRKDQDRIFVTGVPPRVSIKFKSGLEKTGRMKPSSIEITGDKIYVDAYKKMVFNGNKNVMDVIRYVKKVTGDKNA
tara:strand:- start:47 stop:355 length:309 start_codon:yes stop_codon:yes gene_type:complete